MLVAEQEIGEVKVEFAGEWFTVDPEAGFTIGRSGDLELDDNRFLHRQFLTISHEHGYWWLSNVGRRISATVASGNGTIQSWLSPGAKLPIMFREAVVVFTAGPTTYEIMITYDNPQLAFAESARTYAGDSTVMPANLTMSQMKLVVALAEPLLRHEAVSVLEIPSSADAAARLGWTSSKFNRKLDVVCDKLDQAGVPGLRAGGGKVAANRRARLVEYAVSSHMVSAADLELLETDDEEELASE